MGTPPPVSYSGSFYTTPVTPSAPQIKTEDVRYGYPYDQSYNNAWQYSNDYHMVSQPPNYYNTSSCVDAANIIRTMRSDAGSELEGDMSCRVPDQNCYMNNNNNNNNNNMVFNIMSKYPHQHSMV
jgi:hypothetical protein